MKKIYKIVYRESDFETNKDIIYEEQLKVIEKLLKEVPIGVEYKITNKIIDDNSFFENIKNIYISIEYVENNNDI